MSLSKIGVRRWSLFLSYVGHYSFLSVMRPMSGGRKLLSDQTVGQLGRWLAKTAAHTIILSSDSDNTHWEKKRGNKTSLVSHPSSSRLSMLTAGLAQSAEVMSNSSEFFYLKSFRLFRDIIWWLHCVYFLSKVAKN